MLVVLLMIKPYQGQGGGPNLTVKVLFLVNAVIAMHYQLYSSSECLAQACFICD